MFFRKLSFLRRRGNETLWVILPRQYHMLPKQKWREKLNNYYHYQGQIIKFERKQTPQHKTISFNR